MEKLVVTEAFYGGESGIEAILNNYYEDAIQELSSDDDQMKARKFIEEVLVQEGRRVGIPAGLESTKHNIQPDLLQTLLDRRLIRAEITHLGKSYEVSHDVMVKAIQTSHEKRLLREEKAKRLAERRKYRKRIIRLILFAIVQLALISVLLFLLFSLQNKSEELNQANSRLEETNQELAEVNNNLQGLIDKNLNNTRKNYEEYLKAGQNFMEVEDNKEAIRQFNNAIQEITNFSNNFNQSLADSIDQGGATADSLLSIASNKATAQDAEDVKLEQLINEARAYEEKGGLRLLEARLKYQEALQQNPGSSISRIGLQRVNRDLESLFQVYISNGDRFFRINNRDAKIEALAQYRNALKIKPNDSDIQEKIKNCEAFLDQ